VAILYHLRRPVNYLRLHERNPCSPALSSTRAFIPTAQSAVRMHIYRPVGPARIASESAPVVYYR